MSTEDEKIVPIYLTGGAELYLDYITKLGEVVLSDKETDTKTLIKDGHHLLDGGGSYKVVDPRFLLRGKSYSEWTADWFNWFISADADKRTSGPVVFLRSHGLPNRITGAFISDVPDQPGGADPVSDQPRTDVEYGARYNNDPNIRTGSDRLQIYDDQFIFVPIIIAYDESAEPFKDWGWMLDFTGLTIDNGDNPPRVDQLTINNRPVNLGQGLDMTDFRIVTPIFPAVVPDVQYGRSIKDFLEDSPIPPGTYSAMVDGYFVILKFTPGRYWVHSKASAPRERSGPYFSELLYQIDVEKREVKSNMGLIQSGTRTRRRPARNEGIFKRTLAKKLKDRELTDPEVDRFMLYLSS